jgi:O-antigen ligase
VRSGLDIFRFTCGPDDTRTALYASASEILGTSPIVCVDLGQIMVPAQAKFPELVAGRGPENLHAEWETVAAMAGALGLLDWRQLLGAPLLLLVDRRSRQDLPIVLAAILLATGQFISGVSNAAFGILPQTVIYAVGPEYFSSARCYRPYSGVGQVTLLKWTGSRRAL